MSRTVPSQVDNLISLFLTNINSLMQFLSVALEETDAVLLIGTNPRYEAPLVNTRLRKAYVHNEMDLALIGPKVDLSYKYDHLGENASLIEDICNGSHAFAKVLQEAKRPAIILGAAMLERPDGDAIHAKVLSFCKKLSKPVSSLDAA